MTLPRHSPGTASPSMITQHPAHGGAPGHSSQPGQLSQPSHNCHSAPGTTSHSLHYQNSAHLKTSPSPTQTFRSLSSAPGQQNDPSGRKRITIKQTSQSPHEGRFGIPQTPSPQSSQVYAPRSVDLSSSYKGGHRASPMQTSPSTPSTTTARLNYLPPTCMPITPTANCPTTCTPNYTTPHMKIQLPSCSRVPPIRSPLK